VKRGGNLKRSAPPRRGTGLSRATPLRRGTFLKRKSRIRAKRDEALLVWGLEVRTRDGFACRACGKTGIVDPHHIRPRSCAPRLKYEVDNGITLCRECHGAVHDRIGTTNLLLKKLQERLRDRTT